MPRIQAEKPPMFAPARKPTKKTQATTTAQLHKAQNALAPLARITADASRAKATNEKHGKMNALLARYQEGRQYLAGCVHGDPTLTFTADESRRALTHLSYATLNLIIEWLLYKCITPEDDLQMMDLGLNPDGSPMVQDPGEPVEVADGEEELAALLAGGKTHDLGKRKCGQSTATAIRSAFASLLNDKYNLDTKVSPPLSRQPDGSFQGSPLNHAKFKKVFKGIQKNKQREGESREKAIPVSYDDLRRMVDFMRGKIAPLVEKYGNDPTRRRACLTSAEIYEEDKWRCMLAYFTTTWIIFARSEETKNLKFENVEWDIIGRKDNKGEIVPPHLRLTVVWRKTNQDNNTKKWVYELYDPTSDEAANCAKQCLDEWRQHLALYADGGVNPKDSDYLFPKLVKTGGIHLAQSVTATQVSEWLDEVVDGAGLMKGRKCGGSYTSHGFRRGAAQYFFGGRPVHARWSLQRLKSWAGWAPGESKDVLMGYLLDDLNRQEAYTGDSLRPGRLAAIEPSTADAIHSLGSSMMSGFSSLVEMITLLRAEVVELRTSMSRSPTPEPPSSSVPPRSIDFGPSSSTQDLQSSISARATSSSGADTFIAPSCLPPAQQFSLGSSSSAARLAGHPRPAPAAHSSSLTLGTVEQSLASAPDNSGLSLALPSPHFLYGTNSPSVPGRTALQQTLDLANSLTRPSSSSFSAVPPPRFSSGTNSSHVPTPTSSSHCQAGLPKAGLINNTGFSLTIPATSYLSGTPSPSSPGHGPSSTPLPQYPMAPNPHDQAPISLHTPQHTFAHHSRAPVPISSTAASVPIPTAVPSIPPPPPSRPTTEFSFLGPTDNANLTRYGKEWVHKALLNWWQPDPNQKGSRPWREWDQDDKTKSKDKWNKAWLVVVGWHIMKGLPLVEDPMGLKGVPDSRMLEKDVAAWTARWSKTEGGKKGDPLGNIRKFLNAEGYTWAPKSRKIVKKGPGQKAQQGRKRKRPNEEEELADGISDED